MPAPGRDLVFVSYSHQNPEWCERLLILLKPFVRQGRLQVWADRYIEHGSLWRRDIDTALDRTAVGVILLTPELLASDFVADVEIPRLLRAAQAGELTLLIVPIGTILTAPPCSTTLTSAIFNGRGRRTSPSTNWSRSASARWSEVTNAIVAPPAPERGRPSRPCLTNGVPRRPSSCRRAARWCTVCCPAPELPSVGPGA